MIGRVECQTKRPECRDKSEIELGRGRASSVLGIWAQKQAPQSLALGPVVAAGNRTLRGIDSPNVRDLLQEAFEFGRRLERLTVVVTFWEAGLRGCGSMPCVRAGARF